MQRVFLVFRGYCALIEGFIVFGFDGEALFWFLHNQRVKTVVFKGSWWELFGLFQTLLELDSESADVAISFTGLILVSLGFQGLCVRKRRFARLKDFEFLLLNLERSFGNDSQGKLWLIDKWVYSKPGLLSFKFFFVLLFSSEGKQSMFSLKIPDLLAWFFVSAF